MKRTLLVFLLVLAGAFANMDLVSAESCKAPEVQDPSPQKLVIYQVFTRLFGNQQEEFVPWGTIEENSVGKFNDFTDAALEGIRELGTTHIWYTGVLHHAVITDYSEFGISNDDPDVVKGRAGSPYAVKDYYQVDPDLAEDPAHRLEEFEALIARTHRHGMKVMIDIVPNHIARAYKGLNNPEGVVDFGATDDLSVEYARDNNFYYIPGEAFEVPDLPDAIQPLGGDPHPLIDGKFNEFPAKWTGNGARKVKPDANDWYETVKINYGVRPDGSHDFPALPRTYADRNWREHAAFWKGKDVPDSWSKFRDIALFWLELGVDGFRFDMAEMVPVEFWSYLNSSIKQKNADAILLAEVYQPHLYRDYIHLGKMDFLYDKVDLYDTLKGILRGETPPDHIVDIQESIADIEHHMLHFLENHDEQRIASQEFAGDPFRALPLMVLSATISTSPTMLYFGQDVGEDGSEDAGFGDPSRTSIFDYVGVPAHQRWMNGGAFDGGSLNEDEKRLRAFYVKLLNLTTAESAFAGKYAELHRMNLHGNSDYPAQDVYAFVRWSGQDVVLVVVNFSDTNEHSFELKIPGKFLGGLTDVEASGNHCLEALLGEGPSTWSYDEASHLGSVPIQLEPSESCILKFTSER